jgi:hypothetical protein
MLSIEFSCKCVLRPPLIFGAAHLNLRRAEFFTPQRNENSSKCQGGCLALGAPCFSAEFPAGVTLAARGKP